MSGGAELRKIAEGREAEIFAWENNTVLRLLRNTNAQQQVEWEQRAMQAARDAGASVPAVHGTITVDGRPGLIMERVEGQDLLTLLGRRPWLVWWAGRLSGELHASLHEVVAPPDLPTTKEVYRRRMARSDRVPADVRALAEETLEGLPDGDRICHGDYHPGNIIRTEGAPAIIDWTNVTRGDPTADFARAHLTVRLGEPPPGSPLVIRVGAKGLRGLLLGSYVGGYKRKRPIDWELTRRWETAVAANRLADGIPEEREKLLRLLEGYRKNR